MSSMALFNPNVVVYYVDSMCQSKMSVFVLAVLLVLEVLVVLVVLDKASPFRRWQACRSFNCRVKSTMDNMDDHPSSSIGLESVWMVIHGSSVGPWMVV